MIEARYLSVHINLSRAAVAIERKCRRSSDFAPESVLGYRKIYDTLSHRVERYLGKGLSFLCVNTAINAIFFVIYHLWFFLLFKKGED